MGEKHAIINLSSRHVSPEPDKAWPGPAPATILLNAQDVRAAMTPSRLWRSFQRYQSVDLVVDDRRAILSIKPLLAARLLSRGPCRLIDAGGAQPVRWRDIAQTAAQTIRDMWRMPGLRRAVDTSLADLAQRPAAVRHAGEGPPLYVRADLWYGVSAGGSIGHIAGVLKGLQDAGWPAVLATTETIPTIPPDTAVLPLTPHRRHLLQSEWQQLAFNLDLCNDLIAQWPHPPPRFIYQRHGLHIFAGAALARRWNVPFILEFNGPEIWVAEHWGRPLSEWQRAQTCETVSLDCADRIIVVSTVLSDMLKARGVPEEKIRIIPNGVDTEKFSPLRDGTAMRKRFGVQGKTVIGFIGTFGPWHGVENLVTAFAQLMQRRPDLHASLRLLMVGDGLRMAAARNLVAENHIAPFVIFTGLLPQADGPEAISAFDIATAPTVDNTDGSSFFGSPTKLFEYLAAGKATVCTAVAQVRDIIRDGETGLLVPAGDTNMFSAALERLVDDPALRERLGHAARTDAVARHDHAARTRQLMEAVNSVQPQ